MIFSKEYFVDQTSSHHDSRKDYYKWAIWIVSAESDISEIEYVEYLLHSTFKNRLRKITDPSEGFRLKSAGWGEFRVEITIVKKTGEMLQLAHWLSLRDDNANVIARGAPPEIEQKKIYISYSRMDERKAQLLESMLIDLGMEVASGSDIKPGIPIDEYIEESIKEADAVITIHTDQQNDWQKTEIEIAEGLAKTIIPMDQILDQTEEESPSKSRFYSDEEYGMKLKSLGDKFTNLKF